MPRIKNTPEETDAAYARRPIAMYLHCVQCLKEGATPQDISAGLHHDGESIVIWCNRHEIGVAKLALLDPPILECAECEAGTHGHRH